MTNNEKLKMIMAEKELSHAEIADLTGYSVDTVKGWCADPSTTRHREMKDRQFRTLELELKERNLWEPH
jgi:hypothetical protein